MENYRDLSLAVIAVPHQEEDFYFSLEDILKERRPKENILIWDEEAKGWVTRATVFPELVGNGWTRGWKEEKKKKDEEKLRKLQEKIDQNAVNSIVKKRFLSFD